MSLCHRLVKQHSTFSSPTRKGISLCNIRTSAIHPAPFPSFSTATVNKCLQRPSRILFRQRYSPTAPELPLQRLAVRNFSYSVMRYTAQHTKQTATVSAEQGNEPVVHKTGGRISQFIQHSKELVRFYKDGLKQIWSNYQLTKEIRGKLEKDGMDSLTRQEFQLLRRSQKDMIKLIPFGFIFMILPESIPLFVIFVPGMIPSTCLKENQIRKQREKLDEKRQQITKYTLMSSKKIEAIKPEDFLSKDKFRKLAIHYGHEFDLQYIMRKNLSAYCRFMGLSDFGPAPMLRKRLAKHMNYLDQDDRFLIKENSVDTLSPKELCQAVEERGMRSIDDDEENMRRGLKYWLSLSQPTNPKQTKIPPGLLVFSRVFLLNATYK